MKDLNRRTFFGVIAAAFAGTRVRAVGVDLAQQPDFTVTFTAVDPVFVDRGAFLDSYGLQKLARTLQDEGGFWDLIGQHTK